MLSVPLLLSVLGAQPAHADIPASVHIEFFAFDSVGNPINGFVAAQFSIYDASTAGTMVWTGNYTVEGVDGRIAAYIGGGASPMGGGGLNGDSSVQDRWLDVAINGGPSLPQRWPLDADYPNCANGEHWVWFMDSDADGWGVPGSSTLTCSSTPPTGYAAAGDCNDADAAIEPTADELCDAVDHDCNTLPELGAVDATEYWTDSDADGFGDLNAPEFRCAIEAGLSDNSDDCDDADAAVNPDADELCAEGDQNCDGDDDVEAIDAPAWYLDADFDGYGDPLTQLADCTAPSGHVDNADDCDDADAEVFPGAPELSATDGIDQDCDGTAEETDVGSDTGGESGGCNTGAAPVGGGLMWVLMGLLPVLRRRS